MYTFWKEKKKKKIVFTSGESLPLLLSSLRYRLPGQFVGNICTKFAVTRDDIAALDPPTWCSE